MCASLAWESRVGGASVAVLDDSFLMCSSHCTYQGGPWPILRREMCPSPKPIGVLYSQYKAACKWAIVIIGPYVN